MTKDQAIEKCAKALLREKGQNEQLLTQYPDAKARAEEFVICLVEFGLLSWIRSRYPGRSRPTCLAGPLVSGKLTCSSGDLPNEIAPRVFYELGSGRTCPPRCSATSRDCLPLLDAH